MKRQIHILFALMAVVTLSTSCKQLFTTSLGSSFARTGSVIPANASVADLLDIAGSDDATDKQVATDILNALAGKPDDVAGLSTADQQVVLDLALDATIDLPTVLDAIDAVMTGGTDSADEIIAAVLDSVNTSVDLAAITAILNDPSAQAEVPVASLVTASIAVLADIAGTVAEDSTAIEDIMSATDRDAAIAAADLTDDQKADIQTVVDLMETLNTTRPDELAAMEFGGYSLGDYLTEGA